MKKDIFHIIESSATGTLAVVSMIANMQKKHGHNVNIIYSKREETPEDFEKYFHDGIKIKEIRMSGFINIFNAHFSLRRHLSNYESHIFLHSSFAGFIGRIALLGIKQIKLFYVPHSISLMKYDINNLIAGSIGDISAFSFNAMKVLGGLGDGGAIVFDNKDFLSRSYSLRHSGMCSLDGDNITEISGNFRMDALHASFLEVRLDYYQEKIKKNN